MVIHTKTKAGVNNMVNSFSLHNMVNIFLKRPYRLQTAGAEDQYYYLDQKSFVNLCENVIEIYTHSSVV